MEESVCWVGVLLVEIVFVELFVGFVHCAMLMFIFMIMICMICMIVIRKYIDHGIFLSIFFTSYHQIITSTTFLLKLTLPIQLQFQHLQRLIPTITHHPRTLIRINKLFMMMCPFWYNSQNFLS